MPQSADEILEDLFNGEDEEIGNIDVGTTVPGGDPNDEIEGNAGLASAYDLYRTFDDRISRPTGHYSGGPSINDYNFVNEYRLPGSDSTGCSCAGGGCGGVAGGIS